MLIRGTLLRREFDSRHLHQMKDIDADCPRSDSAILSSFTLIGVLAQLGERMAGSHEVRGSIPLRSTNV